MTTIEMYKNYVKHGALPEANTLGSSYKFQLPQKIEDYLATHDISLQDFIQCLNLLEEYEGGHVVQWYLGNFDSNYMSRNIQDFSSYVKNQNIYGIILKSFYWNKTPQGHSYWDSVYDRVKNKRLSKGD